MTRALQDRLALANVKIQNGWENLSLDAIEPQVEERLRRRKRPASSNDTISDTASTTSSRLHSSAGLASSPITEPLFSDEYQRSGGSVYRHKRIRPTEVSNPTVTAAVTGRRTRGAAQRQNTWKKNQGLAVSSPIKALRSSPIKHSNTRSARYPSHQVSHLSFISEGSTIADEPHSPEFSEEDDADLPVTSFINRSFRMGSSRITSSPPHTPPSNRQTRMSNKVQNIAWSRTPRTGGGDDGADLLMYLATSPSPAIGHSRSARQPVLQAPPTTPPCKSTPLPSSHMTPGMTGNGFLGGFSTPGTTPFDFGDFVTFTPTPGASARRKLNFDPLPSL